MSLVKSKEEILSKYLPESSIEKVFDLMNKYKFHFKITRSRTSKLGDYTSPARDKGHRVTVNHDLNQYLFLITLIHEIAHLVVWEKFKNKIQPHGKEWKEEFKILLNPFLSNGVFPDDVYLALANYIRNPAAGSCSDQNLLRVLRKYNNKSEHLHLEDIPENSVFKLKNGRLFIKGKKLRKRFKCVELRTKHNYLISALAEVTIENNQLI